MAISPDQLNPLGALGIGKIGIALLIIFLAILIIGGIGFAIWIFIQKKKLKYTIPLHKKIGNQVVRVATYKARDFKIGMAGDKLWFVPKAKKYISMGTLQTAPNEYTHFEREDGEWINISYPDIDAEMKKAKVKYVDTDMRSNRIAIGEILEQRFKGKTSWWEKYGHLVTHVIFYLVVCIALVVIFYQWSNIVERTGTLLDKIIAYEDLKCPAQQGVVPAIVLFLIKPFRRKNGCNNIS